MEYCDGITLDCLDCNRTDTPSPTIAVACILQQGKPHVVGQLHLIVTRGTQYSVASIMSVRAIKQNQRKGDRGIARSQPSPLGTTTRGFPFLPVIGPVAWFCPLPRCPVPGARCWRLALLCGPGPFSASPSPKLSTAAATT